MYSLPEIELHDRAKTSGQSGPDGLTPWLHHVLTPKSPSLATRQCKILMLASDEIRIVFLMIVES